MKGMIKFSSPGALTLIIAAVLILAGCAGPAGRQERLPEPDTGQQAEDESTDAEIAEVLANQAASDGNYGQAASILEKQLENTPENTDLLRLLARVYAAGGRSGKSSAAWKKVYSLDSSDPDAAYEVAIDLSRGGDWRGVREALAGVEAAGTADKRHYLLLGEANMELGYRTKAEGYLEQASGLERAETLLGEIYYGRRKYSRAEKAFRSVLKRSPQNYSANLHLGYIHYSRKEYRKALRYYRAAVEAAPRSSHAMLSLAALYRAMGKEQKAIKYFRKGLSLPGVPPDEGRRAYNTLCVLLIRAGDYSGVIRAARRGSKIYPGAGGLYYYMGIALYKTGSRAEAKRMFKKAAEDPRWKNEALKKFHAIR